MDLYLILSLEVRLKGKSLRIIQKLYNQDKQLIENNEKEFMLENVMQNFTNRRKTERPTKKNS